MEIDLDRPSDGRHRRIGRSIAERILYVKRGLLEQKVGRSEEHEDRDLVGAERPHEHHGYDDQKQIDEVVNEQPIGHWKHGALDPLGAPHGVAQPDERGVDLNLLEVVDLTALVQGFQLHLVAHEDAERSITLRQDKRAILRGEQQLLFLGEWGSCSSVSGGLPRKV